jgi:protein SCO1/2
MARVDPMRHRATGLAVVLAIAVLASGRPVLGQKLNAPAPGPLPELPPPPSMLTRVGVDQKLGEQLPLDLEFKDAAGRTVRLGDYFNHGRPVVLNFVYFGCPSLCTMTLTGVVGATKPLSLKMGVDYDVVTVSFDPSEGPDLARMKKASYRKLYGRDDMDAGWHFLTGAPDAIAKLTDAAGYRYVYDEQTKQFAHGSAIMVVTPQGKLSHYLYGLEYAPKNLRLALVESAEGTIGSLADQLLLMCYQYDPTSGKYGFAIMTAIRTGAVLTMLGLAAFIGVSIYRDRRSALVAADAPRPAAPDAADDPSRTPDDRPPH